MTGVHRGTRRWRGSMGLTTRVFLGTAAIVVAVVVAALVSVSITANRAADDAARRGLEQSADLVAQFLAGRERTLVGGARVFVQSPYFRTLVAERRRDDVLDRAYEAAEQIEAAWVFITDENGVLIAKSDEPGVSGVAMGQVPLVAGALRGQVTSGFGVSGDTTVFQAVAVPIVAQPGAPVGVLVATRIVDSLFVHDVRAATSSELLFYARDERGVAHPAASTLGATDSLMAFLARVPASSTRAVRAAAADGDAPSEILGSRVTVDGTDYLARGTSLSTAGGEVVGGFLVLRARGSGSATFAVVGGPLLVAMAVGLLVALLATLYAARFVTRPVRALAGAVSEAAEGNLASPFALAGTTRVREIHALADSFQGLIRDLRDREALVSAARVPASTDVGPGASLDRPEPPRLARASGARLATGASAQPRQIARPGLVLQADAVLANRYRIDGEIGRGGLGIVYRAFDRVLGETIAIKMLRPEIVAADPAAFERLKAETRITRRLSHRNVVRTHDIGESEHAPFLTMEYVDGASLATVIQSRGALPHAAVLSIAKGLLRALAVAHRHGIVHGDIKPQNLLIDGSGLLKVTDFGVARMVRTRTLPSGGVSRDGRTSPVSGRLSGAVLGTPEYMAPEQLIGEPSSERTDIYAAGVVLQECLSGNTPDNADTPVAFVTRNLGPHDTQRSGRDARPSDQAESGDPLVRIVDSMRDPLAASRPHSAEDLLTQFAVLG